MSKERQEQIIYENSKNSKYFLNALEKDKKTDARIEKMKEKLSAITNAARLQSKEKCLNEMKQLEIRRDFTRICCVLDMDMFFAAVEIRDRPDLKDKPVAVGGEGMISTSNYVARQYGVRAAMPGFIAKKLCPHLVFVPGNYEKYKVASQQMCAVIADYDAWYRSGSLDEVYFDLTLAADFFLRYSGGTNMTETINTQWEKEYLHRSSQGVVCGEHPTDLMRTAACLILSKIRRRISEATHGLTCSAGLANNFLLAKIAADVNKPDGQYEVGADREKILTFISSLHTRKIPGIGKVSEKELAAFEMIKMADVREKLYIMRFVYTKLAYTNLLRSALGMTEEELSRGARKDVQLSPNASTKKQRISTEHLSGKNEDNGTFNEDDDSSDEFQEHLSRRERRRDEVVGRKGISVERTFRNISSLSEQRQKLGEICNHLEKDMAREDLAARKFTLKLKSSEFAVTCRCRSRGKYLRKADEIFQLMDEALVAEQPITLRLLGVRASCFLGDDNTGASSSLMRDFLGGNLNAQIKTKDGGNNNGNSTSDEVNQCPICEATVVGSLVEFNKHIDACLERQEEEHLSQSQPEPTRNKEAANTLMHDGNYECDNHDIYSAIVETGKSNIPCPSGFSLDVWNCLPHEIKVEQVQSMKLTTPTTTALSSASTKKIGAANGTKKSKPIKSSRSLSSRKGLITNCFKKTL